MDADDSVETAETTTTTILTFALAEFRKQYPYMKDATLQKLLEKLSTTCYNGLVKQEPEHRATKSRINIFSLSAELRNEIYALALPGGKRSITEKRPGLLAANRQVRAEALSLYYATPLAGRVYLFGTASDVYRLRKFFQIIGPRQAALIKEFVLVLEYEELPERRLSRYVRLGRSCGVRRREYVLGCLGLLGFGVPLGAWRLESCDVEEKLGS